MSFVSVSKTFMRSVSVHSWVLDIVGSSSNNVHLNSCPLGSYTWSVSFASTLYFVLLQYQW